MSHRVVITGMGIFSPIGGTLDEFRDNLIAGVSGVAPITLFDPASFRTPVLCAISSHSNAENRRENEGSEQ